MAIRIGWDKDSKGNFGEDHYVPTDPIETTLTESHHQNVRKEVLK